MNDNDDRKVKEISIVLYDDNVCRSIAPLHLIGWFQISVYFTIQYEIDFIVYCVYHGSNDTMENIVMITDM